MCVCAGARLHARARDGPRVFMPVCSRVRVRAGSARRSACALGRRTLSVNSKTRRCLPRDMMCVASPSTFSTAVTRSSADREPAAAAAARASCDAGSAGRAAPSDGSESVSEGSSSSLSSSLDHLLISFSSQVCEEFQVDPAPAFCEAIAAASSADSFFGSTGFVVDLLRAHVKCEAGVLSSASCIPPGSADD